MPWTLSRRSKSVLLGRLLRPTNQPSGLERYGTLLPADYLTVSRRPSQPRNLLPSGTLAIGAFENAVDISRIVRFPQLANNRVVPIADRPAPRFNSACPLASKRLLSVKCGRLALATLGLLRRLSLLAFGRHRCRSLAR
jgi:hypothetical protein